MKTPEETRSRPVAPIVNSADDWRAEILRLAQKKTPSFFHLTAPLPSTGRTNQVLGATDMLSVVLKTYAEGGENELHAHPNEDHVFVVLQGGGRGSKDPLERCTRRGVTTASCCPPGASTNSRRSTMKRWSCFESARPFRRTWTSCSVLEWTAALSMAIRQRTTRFHQPLWQGVTSPDWRRPKKT